MVCLIVLGRVLCLVTARRGTCRRAQKKGSEWWNEEVGRAVAEKRRGFEEWLQRRDRVTNDRYRAQRVVVKRTVRGHAKKNGGPAMGRAIGKLFRGLQKDVLERGKAGEER